MKKVLFIHGRGSSSKTKKVVHLTKFFNVRCLDMETKDINHDLQLQEKELFDFKPDVLIGSSYGGAIAVMLLQQKKWTGPTILLAQAFTKYKPNDIWLPENVPITLIHGVKDDICEIEGSRELAKSGTPNLVKLIEVDDEHRLEGTIDTGVLVNAVNELTK